MRSFVDQRGWRIAAASLFALLLAVVARNSHSIVSQLPAFLSATSRRVLTLTITAAALAGILVTVKSMLWPAAEKLSELKRLLIAGTFVSAGVLVFLLPPFQGPDETAHWANALWFYRSDVRAEPMAYNLHVILEASAAPFHPEVKFDAQKLHANPDEHLYDIAPPPDYIYVHPHSYPLVGLVALIFPKVETLGAALTFFYMCRCISLICLIVLLYYLNKHYEAPYTLLVFFSLPLVMQQSVVITADTLLNLGTICAVMLFFKLRREPDRNWTIALWVLCLAMIYSKPIVAGVLLLPVSLLPVRTIPRRNVVVPLFGCALVGAVYVTSLFVIDGMRRSKGHFGIDAVNYQLASLQTWSGLRHLAAGFLRIALRCCDPRKWSGPLGWLDTELNPTHQGLILVSVAVALFADAIVYVPRIRNAWRTHRAEVWRCVWLIGAIVFINILCETLIYFVIGVPLNSAHIVAWQMRHMFSCFIAALILPVMLAPRSASTEPLQTTATLFDFSVIALLLILLVMRDIELSVDVLVRYW